MTDGSILAPAQVTIADTPTSINFNYGIGNYPLTEGTFFNPFTVDAVPNTTIYSNLGTSTPSIFDTTADGPMRYDFDSYIAGSPGKADFYQNNINGLSNK